MNNFSIKDVIFYMECCRYDGWMTVFPSRKEEWTTAMMWYLWNKEMGYGVV